MEAIGTLCRWLSGCKGTDNNRPDQIKFDFFAKRPLYGCVYCPLYDVFRLDRLYDSLFRNTIILYLQEVYVRRC